ncbi:MAG: hypothetical protein L0215_03540 [Gemmataceae bacterium]|nr:hypothetical protein [Gemmataceae bacterium]
MIVETLGVGNVEQVRQPFVSDLLKLASGLHGLEVMRDGRLQFLVALAENHAHRVEVHRVCTRETNAQREAF